MAFPDPLEVKSYWVRILCSVAWIWNVPPKLGPQPRAFLGDGRTFKKWYIVLEVRFLQRCTQLKGLIRPFPFLSFSFSHSLSLSTSHLPWGEQLPLSCTPTLTYCLTSPKAKGQSIMHWNIQKVSQNKSFLSFKLIISGICYDNGKLFNILSLCVRRSQPKCQDHTPCARVLDFWQCPHV
jgi:hypothetical protein